MMTLLLVVLFLLMIAAPCFVAMRSGLGAGPGSGEGEDSQATETLEQATAEPSFREPSFREPSFAASAPLPAEAFVPQAENHRYDPEPRRTMVSLEQLAAQAEREAMLAERRAQRAYWAALDAAARAAAIRADAAAEVAELAGRAAVEAIRAAKAEFGDDFLREIRAPHSPPRSDGDRRAA